MQIVPVLDILNGSVVHGRAGDRSSYVPIQSKLVDNAEPLSVLAALTTAAGSDTAYIADLNGLMTGIPQTALLKQLADKSMPLMIDAGIQSVEHLDAMPNADHVKIVLASESISSEADLRSIVAHGRGQNFVFSFDFVDDQLRSPIEEWNSNLLPDIAELVWQLGITDWIVLDVRSVGMDSGPTSLQRCRQLKRLFPDANLTTGGGVRNSADLIAIEDCGASSVLVATALHRRQISKTDVR